MPNAGYPDDDGSRDPGGIHGEGCKTGTSYYNVARMMHAATVRDSLNNDLPVNNQSDSSGDMSIMTPNYPVDGDANTNPVHRATADYPPFNSMG